VQYFLGSCYMWREQKDCGCSHTLVAELVSKIISKIEAGEDFCAYICIPLFPEGDPYADSVKAILKYQKLTIEAMYDSIHQVLSKINNGKKPMDYLQFLCLGKREAGPQDGDVGVGNGKALAGILSHRNRRFMIYVHSKLMIVDDETAIVGMAQIVLSCWLCVAPSPTVVHSLRSAVFSVKSGTLITRLFEILHQSFLLQGPQISICAHWRRHETLRLPLRYGSLLICIHLRRACLVAMYTHFE
jgi:hypothetical protein